MGEDTPPGPHQVVENAINVLIDHGVRAIVLARYGAAVLDAGTYEAEILVPWRQLRRARDLVDQLDWSYRVGGQGLWVVRQVAYSWPGGAQLFVAARLPTPPFLFLSGRRLASEVCSSASPHTTEPPEPDLDVRLVYLAVKALGAQGTYPRPARRLFTELIQQRAAEGVDEIAARVGLQAAVRTARQGAQEGRWRSSIPRDGRIATEMTRLSSASVRRWAPPRLARWLYDAPVLGAAPTRARVGDVEVRVPAGAFVPTPDAARLARLAGESTFARPGVHIADVGCATGGIALAIAARRPDVHVLGTELMRDAVRVAKRNARRLQLRNVEFRQGSLLEPLRPCADGRLAVVVANLPFYPEGRAVGLGDVNLATIEGEDDDGLGLYRQLLRDLPRLAEPRCEVILQMFGWQWQLLADELRHASFEPVDAIAAGPFVFGRARAGWS